MNYEAFYIQTLKECKIDEAFQQLKIDKVNSLRRKNYEQYAQVIICYVRLKLFTAEYHDLERKLKDVADSSYYVYLKQQTKAHISLLLSKIAYSKGGWEEAEQLAEDAMAYGRAAKENGESDDCYLFCRAYLVLAKVQFRQRDVYRAKLLMAKSFLCYKDSTEHTNGHYMRARLLSHYAQICMLDHTIVIATSLIEESKQVYDSAGYKPYFYLPEINSHWGAVLIAQGEEYDKAREKLKEAFRLLHMHFPKCMNRQKAHICYLLGMSFLKEAELPGVEKGALLAQAELYFGKELKLRLGLYLKPWHSTIARARNNLAQVYTEIGGEHYFERAIEMVDLALKGNYSRQDSAAKKLSALQKIKGSNSPFEAIRSLFLLARLKYLQFRAKLKKKGALKEAWDTINLAHLAILLIRKEYYNLETKIAVMGQQARAVYEMGLAILYEQQGAFGEEERLELEQRIFEFFYFSKSFLLLESLSPFSLTTLSARPQQSGNASPDMVASLIKNIDECFSEGLKCTLEDEQDKITLLLKINKKTVNSDWSNDHKIKDVLGDIRNQLREEEEGTVLSYFLGEQGLYAMVIRGSEPLQFFQLLDRSKEVIELKKSILDCSAILNGYELEELDDQIFRLDIEQGLYAGLKDKNVKCIGYSSQLYKILIAPLRHALGNRIYIIPDEELFYVPFPFLSEQFDTSGKNKFSVQTYLINNYKISYHLSNALLYWNHNDKRGKEPALADAFRLYSLPGLYTNVELGSDEQRLNQAKIDAVIYIAGLFQLRFPKMQHELLSYSTAEIKGNLQNEGSAIQILHFFGHSYSEGGYANAPCLVLRKNLRTGQLHMLSQAEIQHLALDSNTLVIINACKGGHGGVGNGEGPVSLVQAFLKAGARNIYYSQYKMGAEEILQFSSRVIKRLLEGDNFLDALVNIQRQCLKSGTSDSHPAIWASYSFIGNQMQKIWNPNQKGEQ